MIKVASYVEDVSVPNKSTKKQKISTKPELEAIKRDMFSLVLNMHKSLHDIDRVDTLVFPLLSMRTKTLQVPDAKNNERLSHYISFVERLMDLALKSTKKELKSME